ncbi:unnamed protein product [Linum trigynum]|uniref:Uncharacterized protein n=1 Tax=Linum trigynum TaxID=586398 RepID=A0AAV2G197_9ROSI
MAMKMMQPTSIAKPAAAAVLLLLIICIFPSSASRIIGPAASGNDAPTNVSSHQILASHLVAKRGTGVVTIPQSTSKNSTASVQDYCTPSCNDAACDRYYDWFCRGQDRNVCRGTCDCSTLYCYCYCSE